MGIFLLIYANEYDKKFVSVDSFKNEGKLKHFTVNIRSITWGWISLSLHNFSSVTKSLSHSIEMRTYLLCFFRDEGSVHGKDASNFS